MTNPTAVYNIKGCKIKERQLFVRTYYVQRKLTVGTYFIDGGRAYYISTDDREIVRCNFNVGFLDSGHTKTIEPLNEFYKGTLDKDNPVVEQNPEVPDTVGYSNYDPDSER